MKIVLVLKFGEKFEKTIQRIFFYFGTSRLKRVKANGLVFYSEELLFGFIVFLIYMKRKKLSDLIKVIEE